MKQQERVAIAAAAAAAAATNNSNQPTTTKRSSACRRTPTTTTTTTTTNATKRRSCLRRTELSNRRQPLPPRRSVSFDEDKPTIHPHVQRSAFTEKRLRKCFYQASEIRGFLSETERLAKQILDQATHAAASAMTKKKTKRKSTTKKKSKVHSVNALNQLLDLETEHDDGRGLECFTKSGKLRRQMCVKMAKCAVLQYQKKAPTTTTSCVAQAYQKETKHARDQALVRGRLYSRKTATALVAVFRRR